MTHAPKWGVVATAKASASDILRFAAFHLEAGASRVHIFLDDRNPRAFAALKAHPNCRVTVCDDAYWQRVAKARPEKHQVRQTRNATFGYYRSNNLDWVMHLDVDEFLVSDQPISDVLSALPVTCQTARVRPIEALALHSEQSTPCAFKAFSPNGPKRIENSLQLYPTYGAYLKGGFVSHVAGKVFARTGQAKLSFRIHNTIVDGKQNPGLMELPDVDLAHCHAVTWSDWLKQHAYRHEKGSYREDIKPAIDQVLGGVTLHTLFHKLKQENGDAGLRAFFDEVCADTPEHRARLDELDLLRLHDLDLETKMSSHFPNARD